MTVVAVTSTRAVIGDPAGCGQRGAAAGRRRHHRPRVRQPVRLHHPARRRHRTADEFPQGSTGRPGRQHHRSTGRTAEVWDFDQLPAGLRRRTVLDLWDRFLSLGPFGLRGPAAAAVPRHLTSVDGGVATTQVISPGYSCPSNRVLTRARRAAGVDLLHVTSANQSRHLTGAEDTPAHWRMSGLRADFGADPQVRLVKHADEAAALARYPRHRTTSTSILGFHTVTRVTGDPRPHLVLERHGSLPASVVRQVLADVGLGLVLGPRAGTRLESRDYTGTSLRKTRSAEVKPWPRPSAETTSAPGC